VNLRIDPLSTSDLPGSWEIWGIGSINAGAPLRAQLSVAETVTKGTDSASVNEPLLLPRVAAGERAAMEQCLARFAPLVWSAARRFLGSSPEAEDTVQEIFIELWRKADRYEPALGSETTFVMTLARRRLLDVRRRWSRRPELTPLEEIEEPAAEAAEGSAADDESAQALAVLRALPKEQQQVLELSLRDGCTHSEIASQLALPLGTVKTQLRRGLLRIRQALGVSPAEARP
jgi:RNA polymerase sigma-70 factor (ECF subfamily)